MVKLAPSILLRAQINNPAQGIEEPIKSLAAIQSSGVNAEDYLAFLWWREITIWIPTVLACLLMVWGIHWYTWRQSITSE